MKSIKMPNDVAVTFLMKTWLYVFCNIQTLAPWAVLNSLPLAPSRPEDACDVQAGWDSAEGKVGAGLDSLN